MSLQPLENKALSRGIIGKSTPLLAEITIRKSQQCIVEAIPLPTYKPTILLLLDQMRPVMSSIIITRSIPSIVTDIALKMVRNFCTFWLFAEDKVSAGRSFLFC
jgi:hypothetical protein